MRITTPEGLAYPITVARIPVSLDDPIDQDAVLFTYKYRGKREVYNPDTGNDEPVEVDMYADFESEAGGEVKKLHIREGQVLGGPTAVVTIQEACKHEVQFGGMCANCGKDMTAVESYNQTVNYRERATINATHSSTALTISEEEATKADMEARARLIGTKRLSLVVDLDQTVIQATVDPTVGEWQDDTKNPNHDAVKHVRKFQLSDAPGSSKGTWYYIKLRPGLEKFLETISHFYELHIYTMATRQYAENIANIIDPGRKMFGSRILSRDENGSLHSKSLKRIFPMDTKMVVIIDDRGDIWSWSPNLVKVSAYDFFVGIGDINSSFLPKRPELEKAPPRPKKSEQDGESGTSDTSGSDEKSEDDHSKPSKPSTPASTPPATNGDASAVDRMVSMAGEQDEDSLKEKAKEQDETIAEQLADRPLLQKQKLLEQAEEEAKASPAAEAAVKMLSGAGEKQEEHPRYRYNLLQDDDNELEYLGQTLQNVHHAYFEQYEKSVGQAIGGRVAELKPGPNSKKRSLDDAQLDRIPDAAQIMDDMKRKVLNSVHIVFSGVVPLGVDIQNHDIAIWAKSFGAAVSENIGKKTTHVIASPERRTAKVRQAAKRGGRIAIVNQNWLTACFSQWKRVSEEPYRIHSDAQPNGMEKHKLPDSLEDKNFLLSSSDEEAAQTEDETETTTGTETPNGDLRVDTDAAKVDRELEELAPKSARRDSSDDWDDVNAELEDFLGSEADDGDTDSESVTSATDSDTGELLKTPPSQRKRKRDAFSLDDPDGDGPASAEGESVEMEEGSRLQKRKKEAMARSSSLTNVVATASNGSTPKARVGTDGGADGGGGDQEDDDDLEAMLAAELEKEDE
ncbi:catalytic domain of ctd-like phosphatases [Teratosphaeria destructans]|uniref:RNA polymerase II subunit A C-terminal domain phosphatase n=1 Tax=Teratosphaeria destructans TaxID=418781 RepID=A0A9W7VZL4_9PEZI|nr:catalytic domain of ctd-like phosphatases [Teratosphaeria destructans]